MQKIQHNILVNSAVMVVFFLASSGFTTVLHECRIQQAMSCCAQPGEMKSNACQESGQRTAGQAIESDLTCYSNVLVGGLETAPAVQEKQVRPGQGSPVHAPVSFLSSPILSQIEANSSVGSFLLSPPILPSRERSILFATLLI